MSDTTVAHPFAAYVASLYEALGTRNPMEVLREGPDAFRDAVAGLSRSQLTAPEAPGKWSALQVVQHIADSELVAGFRFRMVLAHDSPGIAGYDQDLWANRLRYQESDVENALGDFAGLRRSNLRLLERTTEADRDRLMRHEERGDESLGRMIEMYAGHDMKHRRQVARIRTAIRA